MPFQQTVFHFDRPLPVVEQLKGSRMTSRQARKQYLERQKSATLTKDEERELRRKNREEEKAEREMIKAQEAKEAKSIKAKKTRETKKAELRRQHLERLKTHEPVKAKWAVDEQQKITSFLNKGKLVADAEPAVTMADTAGDDSDGSDYFPTVEELINTTRV